MNWMLAQDISIPKPPETDSVATWVAVVGILVLVYLVLFSLPKERKESLNAFQTEMKEQREFYAEQLTTDREQRDAIAKEHRESLSGIHERLTDVQTAIAAGKGCKARNRALPEPDDTIDVPRRRTG